MALRQMNQKLLRSVLKQGLRLLVPHADEDAALQAAEKLYCEQILPSTATMNRTRIRAEVSDMLRWRERWQNMVPHCTIYHGLDASQHRSESYEVLLGRTIRHEDFGNLHMAITMLESFHEIVDPDERKGLYSEEKGLMDEIKNLWIDKMFPICHVGASEGNLAKRASVVAHTVRLECGSFKQTADVVRCFGYGLTDEGVESAVSAVDPTTPLESLIPWFKDCEDDKKDSAFEEEDCAAPVQNSETPCFYLSNCLAVSGLLHIISLATKNLKNVLKLWAPNIFALTCICDVFNRVSFKLKLLERCCYNRPPIGPVFGQKIKAFSAYVDEDGWGTVANAIRKVLGIEVEALWGWNMAAMIGNYDHTKELATNATNDEKLEHSFCKKVVHANSYINNRFLGMAAGDERCWKCTVESLILGRVLLMSLGCAEHCL